MTSSGLLHRWANRWQVMSRGHRPPHFMLRWKVRGEIFTPFRGTKSIELRARRCAMRSATHRHTALKLKFITTSVNSDSEFAMME